MCGVVVWLPGLAHLHQLCLTDQGGLREKGHVLLRYDPPVLVVSLTWHEKQSSFSDFLRLRLLMTYFNNAEYV